MVQVETTKEKERRKAMISVGIDISKEKFTICALEQGSKIIWKPFDVSLNKKKGRRIFRETRKIKKKSKNNNGSNRKISFTNTL